jgi:hypothetical protein
LSRAYTVLFVDADQSFVNADQSFVDADQGRNKWPRCTGSDAPASAGDGAC